MGDADLAEELVELLEREDVEDAVALAGALADAGVLSDLIAALRTYSRRDEAPEQDVDLRGGLRTR